MLGYFDSDELDRPELNKCPECECYFASEECPLCGKVCPEAFRAGNRAAVKKPKKTRNSSGRVQFIPWYHTWWFILIMMFFMPVVGIILFFTSPYSKKWKIIGAVIGVLYFVLVYMGVGWKLLDMALSEDPVNDKLSREEYVEKCEEISAEDYYRLGERNEDMYVTMELVYTGHCYVSYVGTGDDLHDARMHYVFTDPSNPNVTVIVRDYQLSNVVNFLKNDRIRVYGEGDGMVPNSMNEWSGLEASYPCVNIAYAEVIKG